MITVKVNTTGARRALQKLASDIESVAHKAVADGIERAHRTAEKSTAFKDRSGETRSSLVTLVNPVGYEASLFSLRKQALWLEEGTVPHVIRAVNAKYLCFQVNGQTVFRTSVHHPGTKATHFMENAVKEEAAHTRDELERNIGSLAARFSR